MNLPIWCIKIADLLYLVAIQINTHFTGDGGVDADERAVLFLNIIDAFGVPNDINPLYNYPLQIVQNPFMFNPLIWLNSEFSNNPPTMNPDLHNSTVECMESNIMKRTVSPESW